MSLINYTIESKKEAVKTIRSNLWIIFGYAALMIALFAIDTKNYIFMIIGFIYTINAFLIKKYMCRTAAVIMLIVSILVGYVMYQTDIVNFALNFLVFLSSIQIVVATFFFHKKTKLRNSSVPSSKMWILPSNILNAIMILYIIIYFDFQSKLLYFDCARTFSIYLIAPLFIVFILMAYLLKKVFPQDKYGVEYYILSIITVLIFVFSTLPNILHSKTKSEITIDAKILKIGKENRTSKHKLPYYSYLIETSNEKLNHQTINDINDNAFYYLKENDPIIIYGEISDYLFKTIDIKFPDKETNKFYKRMRNR